MNLDTRAAAAYSSTGTTSDILLNIGHPPSYIAKSLHIWSLWSLLAVQGAEFVWQTEYISTKDNFKLNII